MDERGPEFVITDSRRPALVRLEWAEFCIRVWLEDPPQIRVSSTVYPGFTRELSDFFRTIAVRPPAGAEELQRVSSNDDELCVEAWAVETGVVGLGVSLASDMWDPNWVVRVNLLVASTDLHRFAEAAERLARFAAGLPRVTEAEPDIGPDR